MDLIVDGIIYRHQSRGGISRIFDNLLNMICELNPELKVKIINTRGMVEGTPAHKNIFRLYLRNLDRTFQPRKLWRRSYIMIYDLLTQLFIGDTSEKIWMSTYYTIPPFKWLGFQVVIAYDCIYEMFAALLPDSARIISQKREAISKADAVICISNSTARDLVKYYQIGEEKIYIAEPGFDNIYKQRSKEEIKYNIDKPFILYVGRREYYKNFSLLLKSYAQWGKKEEISLLAVGPAWSSEEEIFLKNNNLSNQVLLLQGIGDDHLCDLYNQALAFVYPSLYEGFGIPLLEAMVCGCPIAASHITSTVEVAKKVPFYFLPNDGNGLINALNRAIDNGKDNERIRWGLFIASQYTWERTASKVLDVIRIVAGQN